MTVGCFDKFNQRAHGNTGWTFRTIWLSAISPGRAGNIKMRPRDVVSEFLEESGRGNRAGLLAANIFDVGNVALDLFSVFVVQRQLPEFLADFFSGFNHLVYQSLVSAEDRSVDVAERDRNCAGQRRHVDDLGGPQFLCVSDRVGQHQPPFGVGIDNFNRLAGHRGQNIAWLCCFA